MSQIGHCWGKNRHHTHSDGQRLHYSALKCVCSSELRERRRSYQHQAAFQGPRCRGLGQTLHDSALTLPYCLPQACVSVVTSGQQHTGSSACRQRETGNRWAVRADCSPSRTKEGSHQTRMKSADMENVSLLIFASKFFVNTQGSTVLDLHIQMSFATGQKYTRGRLQESPALIKTDVSGASGRGSTFGLRCRFSGQFRRLALQEALPAPAHN